MSKIPLMAAVLAVAPGLVAAQQQPQPPFTSEMRVNNVTVDVQVRDANGVPVTGLARDSFRIFEDDGEQPITNFLAVDGGQVSAAPEGDLVGQPASRQVLIFFDLYLMTEADKTAVVKTIRNTLLGGLPPGMVVAVVSFDGSLRVHTPPTASRSKLDQALKEVDRITATGLQRQIVLTSFVQHPLPSESWASYGARRIQTEEYWSEMRRMVGRVEAAFTAAMQQFAGTPARKIVVLASPGFPRAEELPIYRDYDFWLDTPVEYRNAGLLGQAAFIASELEYTLFTLDVSGSQLQHNAASVAVPPAEDAANVTFWRESDRKGTLIQAAHFTGGESFFTRDAGVAFADVERLTSSYYSLAYQPDHAGDGKQHSIRVEVAAHPEYALTYRAQYVDEPFEARDAERTRAALLTGENANPLGITLVLDKPTSRVRIGARGMHVYRIAAELRIPYANLVMVQRGDTAGGQVQIVVVVVDAGGNQSEVAHRLVPIQLPADTLTEARQHGYFAYRFPLELEGGKQSLRVAVNDKLGNTTSTAIANLDL
jgi:VWFA-related protein